MPLHDFHRLLPWDPSIYFCAIYPQITGKWVFLDASVSKGRASISLCAYLIVNIELDSPFVIKTARPIAKQALKILRHNEF